MIRLHRHRKMFRLGRRSVKRMVQDQNEEERRCGKMELCPVERPEGRAARTAFGEPLPGPGVGAPASGTFFFDRWIRE